MVPPVGPGALESDGAGARLVELRRPLIFYGAVLVALTAIVFVGARVGLIGYYAGSASEFTGSWLVGGWLRWDGGWYSDIATAGYSYAGGGAQSSVAFFPAYPLAIAAVAALTGIHVPLVGVLVTTVAGGGAAVLFFVWSRARVSFGAATLATVLMLVYPYSFYLYGAVYTDALFLCAALGSFVLLERGHPLLAGLVGATATATRPVGIAVIVGLVAVAAMRRGVVRRSEGRLPLQLELRRFERRDCWVLLSAGGLVAWMTYLWIEFGDPLAFQSAQSAPGWGQAPGPRRG